MFTFRGEGTSPGKLGVTSPGKGGVSSPGKGGEGPPMVGDERASPGMGSEGASTVKAESSTVKAESSTVIGVEGSSTVKAGSSTVKAESSGKAEVAVGGAVGAVAEEAGAMAEIPEGEAATAVIPEGEAATAMIPEGEAAMAVILKGEAATVTREIPGGLAEEAAAAEKEVWKEREERLGLTLNPAAAEEAGKEREEGSGQVVEEEKREAGKDVELEQADGGDLFTPKRHLPTPGQRGQSPQRHTAAPLTADKGNTVSPRANFTQTAYAHVEKEEEREYEDVAALALADAWSRCVRVTSDAWERVQPSFFPKIEILPPRSHPAQTRASFNPDRGGVGAMVGDNTDGGTAGTPHPAQTLPSFNPDRGGVGVVVGDNTGGGTAVMVGENTGGGTAVMVGDNTGGVTAGTFPASGGGARPGPPDNSAGGTAGGTAGTFKASGVWARPGPSYYSTSPCELRLRCSIAPPAADKDKNGGAGMTAARAAGQLSAVEQARLLSSAIAACQQGAVERAMAQDGGGGVLPSTGVGPSANSTIEGARAAAPEGVGGASGFLVGPSLNATTGEGAGVNTFEGEGSRAMSPSSPGGAGPWSKGAGVEIEGEGSRAMSPSTPGGAGPWSKGAGVEMVGDGSGIAWLTLCWPAEGPPTLTASLDDIGGGGALEDTGGGASLEDTGGEGMAELSGGVSGGEGGGGGGQVARAASPRSPVSSSASCSPSSSLCAALVAEASPRLHAAWEHHGTQDVPALLRTVVAASASVAPAAAPPTTLHGTAVKTRPAVSVKSTASAPASAAATAAATAAVCAALLPLLETLLASAQVRNTTCTDM